MANLRYLARALAFLPPVLLLVVLVGVASCGKSIFSTSSSSASGTASPTSTSTVTGGGYAFVTNYSSGYITEFKRVILTGVLTYNTRIAAGAANGPKGIAITGNNSFLYATNVKDGNIYQYTVGTDGTLTPMTPPSVSNGVNSSPEQAVTLSINSVPTWLFVSNFGEGSISAYPITSAGPLGKAVTTSGAGMSGPFGLAINAAGTILYASDNARGTIYTFSINTTTGALSNVAGSPIPSQGSVNGSPGIIALGPLFSNGTIPGSYLLVGDTNAANEIVSLFFITSGSTGLPGFVTQAIPSSSAAIGVAWATSAIAGTEIALSANQNTISTASGSISSYILSGNALTNSNNVLPINGPTNIVVDPQNVFAYSTNQGSGTITQYQLNAVCQTGGTTQTICQTPNTIPSDSKILNPAPFGIVLSN
ncbi:MAG: lactonase family protein [Candidatus Binataceae bacterium]